jgi:glucosylceramidase
MCIRYNHFLEKGLLAVWLLSCTGNSFGQPSSWLTDPRQSILFEKQPLGLSFGDGLPHDGSATNDQQIIDVDQTKTFQTIDGFGCCLTGGSAMHLIRMDAASRAELLKDLFATDSTHIGISYLRVSIGASDLNDHAFSYNDLPAGKTDPDLKAFSLEPDRANVIPILKEVLAINPDITILGSPWSPPAWMKDNHDTKAGSLKPECYDAYAKYFVKYIKGMKAEGIHIDAITVQNEPLNPKNNPSLLMLAQEQADFIKNSLGPTFAAAGINTKIILYDHNCDHPEYPVSILNDPAVKKYVDGSAFHLYAGRIEALSEVHAAHPDKNIYFTEQWTGASDNLNKALAPHVQDLIIGATRNWSRNVLEWNLAADSDYQPHTDRGGCDSCQGTVTINGNKVSRNAAYYILAHAAKFVRPGSVRIASNYLRTLPNVAFQTPGGTTVLIVLNSLRSMQSFDIRCRGKVASVNLNGGAVSTYVW